MGIFSIFSKKEKLKEEEERLKKLEKQEKDENLAKNNSQYEKEDDIIKKQIKKEDYKKAEQEEKKVRKLLASDIDDVLDEANAMLAAISKQYDEIAAIYDKKSLNKDDLMAKLKQSNALIQEIEANKQDDTEQALQLCQHLKQIVHHIKAEVEEAVN
ncbi:hypothetical protein J4232_05865 [Candidatus Woesearchaeota archaeon]|nr:hypothetical protein [Candidatus Woesearchaeota archaeon]